jgi:hypothetical protein
VAREFLRTSGAQADKTALIADEYGRRLVDENGNIIVGEIR